MHSVVLQVVLQEVTKRFSSGNVLKSVSLSAEAGQRVAIVGASGSGKTTLLRIIAGLEPPTTGRVLLDGVDVTKLQPNRRGVGIVFQDYATYPRLSVAENLSVGLVGNSLTREDKASRLTEIVSWLGLEGLLQRLPTELSGGQLQRLALGKALVIRPKVLLLDEPFSQLDVRLAEQMRHLLAECHQRYGMTQIIVTHQPIDALCSVDKLALLERGEIVQCDSPDAVRQSPKTLFAAELTSPCGINIVPAALLVGLSLPAGQQVAFRPEVVQVCQLGKDSADVGNIQFKCRLITIRDLGIVKLAELAIAGHRIEVRWPDGQAEPAHGSELTCWVRRKDLLVFTEENQSNL